MLKRGIFTAEHDAFRETVRTFAEKEIAPHHARWEEQGVVDREVWRAAGRLSVRFDDPKWGEIEGLVAASVVDIGNVVPGWC